MTFLSVLLLYFVQILIDLYVNGEGLVLGALQVMVTDSDYMIFCDGAECLLDVNSIRFTQVH